MGRRSMTDQSDDANWQDECFKVIRLNAGLIAEYAPLIKDPDSPAGWTLADLRSTNRDLLQAIEDVDEESAAILLVEARALLIEVLRLCG
jgi:hypothetical protein